MREALLASMIALCLPATALACTPNPDPDLRPWAERVAGSSPMFIGTVVEIRGQDGRSWTEPPVCETRGANTDCEAFHYGTSDVVFTVELPIEGELGATFVVEQGHGSDCLLEFGLGQRWLFAGNSNELPSLYLMDVATN